MGTSATVEFREAGETLCIVYHQSDGYPEYVGVKLAEFMTGVDITNGFQPGAEMTRTANGAGCLAAQYVAHVKTRVGGVYLIPKDTGWEPDFAYFVNVSNVDHSFALIVNDNITTYQTSDPKRFRTYCIEYD